MVVEETQMRFVACIVCEPQLRRYGYVDRFPEADAAHQIRSVREPHEWRRPMGRPCASWLEQVDLRLKEMVMGQASACGIVKRRPLEFRQKVYSATRCSGTYSGTQSVSSGINT